MRIDIHHHYDNYDFDEFAEAFANFKGEIMSKLDELKAAVGAVGANTSAGNAALADALTELSSDVAGLNKQISDLTEKVDNPDLQAEIDDLNEESQRIADSTAAAAKAIRDAIPTAEAPPAETPPASPDA